MKNRKWSWMFASALAGFLAGCGGGGGGGGGNEDGAETGTGVFKDSNVGGLDYVSGEQSGTTDASGRFTFEKGSNITFRVGGVELGTASATGVLTPLELAESGRLTDTDVTNIARFLLMLDSDDNPGNGISISSAVKSVAPDWDQLDFDSGEFDTNAAPIIDEVAAADERTKSLPDAAEAREHFEGTLRCITAGAFRGTFTGDEAGTFGFLVDAGDGSVSGVAYSDNVGMIDLGGGQEVSTDTRRSFTSGIGATGGSFEGEFDTPDSVSGSWDNSLGDTGSFSGSRIGGVIDARYRFTGQFGGNDSGLFAFDVDGEGNVTGVVYSVEEDQLDTLEGTLSGGTLNATTDQGTTITGTLDTTNGTAQGNWSSADGGFAGSFSGSGCELNPPASDSTDGGGGGADDGSGGGVSESGSLQVWSLGNTVTNLSGPVNVCYKFGAADDGTIPAAEAEWMSDGRTVKTETLPGLDKSGQETCGGLTDGTTADRCLYTCLDETGATGPTTIKVTVENDTGDQVSVTTDPNFLSSGPFNGTWQGQSTEEYECADGTSDSAQESGEFRITQGLDSSGNKVIVVYDIVPNDTFRGNLDSSETFATSINSFSSESISGEPVTVTDWEAELVDFDTLEGSASLSADNHDCTGTTTFQMTRQDPA